MGPAGHVTGVDISREFLDHGRELAGKAGLSKQLTLREGDMNDLPFEDDSFDWAWSMSCVGYNPGDPMPALKELVRVVRPGGTVAILVWSSEQLLPGYPLLEARLKATSAGIAPFVRGKKPEQHFLRAPGWFREAGLEDTTARTFVMDFHAPLSDDVRRALAGLFEMRWPGAKAELTPEDRSEFQRLLLPDSQDFILDLPDYYGFFTYTMFQGIVPTG